MTPANDARRIEAEIRAANDNQAMESIGKARRARLFSLVSEEAQEQDREEARYSPVDNDDDNTVDCGVYDD